MTAYVGRRLVYMLITLFVIVALTFCLMKILPGTPFDAERYLSLSPTRQATLMRQYGLDQPVYKQFLQYMRNLLKGDFGISYFYPDRPVLDVIKSRIGPSALVGSQAILMGLFIGMLMGVIAAWRHNGSMDYLTMVVAVLGVSVPNFVVAALLQYFVGLKWGILPVAFWKSWVHSVLPSIALMFSPLASSARFVRTETLDVLSQDYIQTARSKGMSERRMLVKHALRNALLPVVTILGPMIANLLTGSLAIESIFSVPGIGSLFVESVRNNDYPVIMGLTIFFSAFYIVCILLVDISYTLIDPRIRLSKGNEGD
ncbi:MAG: ABC transporter permease [Oscillospiraceae bacterium]|jgi:oligopeptide transport system permease protein|nr:ABC transporter permease [Oscillospiraceae bacterium]